MVGFFLAMSSFLLGVSQIRPVPYLPKSEKLVMLLKKEKAIEENKKWFAMSTAHVMSFSYLPLLEMLAELPVQRSS